MIIRGMVWVLRVRLRTPAHQPNDQGHQAVKGLPGFASEPSATQCVKSDSSY